MTDKEAIIFVIDVGPTMAITSNGRSRSNLDWAMRYVWSKLGDMAASGRKTLCAGVVAFRADETANSMGGEAGYDNISVFADLGPVSLESLRTLQARVRPSAAPAGDAVSAVVVAVAMIEEFTKRNKWIRRIFLVTDGEAAVDSDDMAEIARKMNDIGVQLNVL
jgi:ATP-dependent DNA helicase 2 subunit 2